MILSENTQLWLERMQTEVAAIPTGDRSVVAAMYLAEVQFARGLRDAAGNLTSDEWPGAPANRLVDACRLAGWAEGAAELRRLLPLARQAITAVGTEPEPSTSNAGYWLVRACVRAGLLAEASELADS